MTEPKEVVPVAETRTVATPPRPGANAEGEAHIDIVFDGPPSHESGRFVEVEDGTGKSIKFGEWIHRPDGYWVLRFTADRLAAAPIQSERFAGHIEGPWRIGRYDASGCLVVADACQQGIATAFGSDEIGKANARLIAAAPSLAAERESLYQRLGEAEARIATDGRMIEHLTAGRDRLAAALDLVCAEAGMTTGDMRVEIKRHQRIISIALAALAQVDGGKQ
jgi:hypothetical protein